MATEKQIAANRRNANKGTGPRTEHGKLRSRQNAVRHGLTAETVMTVFEDADEYTAFENSIIADYEPQTAVECALAARLASLLWRLRRATAIETGLLQIQDQTSHNQHSQLQQNASDDPLGAFRNLLLQNAQNNHSLAAEAPDSAQSNRAIQKPLQDAALCFARLNDKNDRILDRIGRYELGLWRQVAQTLLILGNTQHTRPRFWSLPRSWLSRENRY